jgi:hypothetical protein
MIVNELTEASDIGVAKAGSAYYGTSSGNTAK